MAETEWSGELREAAENLCRFAGRFSAGDIDVDRSDLQVAIDEVRAALSTTPPDTDPLPDGWVRCAAGKGYFHKGEAERDKCLICQTPATDPSDHICVEACLHDCPSCGHEVDHAATFHAPGCQDTDPSGPDLEAAWEALRDELAQGAPEPTWTGKTIARHRPIIEAAIRRESAADRYHLAHLLDTANAELAAIHESRAGGGLEQALRDWDAEDRTDDRRLTPYEQGYERGRREAVAGIRHALDARQPAPTMSPDTGPSGLDGIDCPDCGGRGWTFGADPLPSGEPGEPYQVQCGSCEGTGRLADPSGLGDVEAALAIGLADALTKDWPGDTRRNAAPAIAAYLVRRPEVLVAIQESRAGGGLADGGTEDNRCSPYYERGWKAGYAAAEYERTHGESGS